jgi:hypothetical protein
LRTPSSIVDDKLSQYEEFNKNYEMDPITSCFNRCENMPTMVTENVSFDEDYVLKARLL